MRKLLCLLFLAPGLLLAQTSVSGRWMSTADFYGSPLNFPLELKQDGDKITGEFGGDKLEGTLTGNALNVGS